MPINSGCFLELFTKALSTFDIKLLQAFIYLHHTCILVAAKTGITGYIIIFKRTLAILQ